VYVTDGCCWQYSQQSVIVSNSPAFMILHNERCLLAQTPSVNLMPLLTLSCKYENQVWYPVAVPAS
jgi:hypothetical protein